MIRPNTHLGIDRGLVGTPRALEEGSAEVALTPTRAMAADERGLVHGGFVFGLADYAAMLAVNDPLVVLGSAETRFVAPVAVGDEVVARARVTDRRGKKRVVDVRCEVAGREVMMGTFVCFVVDRHVLD